MIIFDEVTGENTQRNNLYWLQIPSHQYKILSAGCSGSEKTNALLNLINHQPDLDKIYLFVKDPYELKYQSRIHKNLINKRQDVGLKHLKDSKAFYK